LDSGFLINVISLQLKDELTNILHCGDHIFVNGIYLNRFNNFPTKDSNESDLGFVNSNPAVLASAYILVSSFEYIPFFHYGAMDIKKAIKVYSVISMKKKKISSLDTQYISGSVKHPLYGFESESKISDDVADIMEKMSFLAESLTRFFLRY
jgi:hypothetical protein